MNDEIIEELRATWPPIFAGKAINELSGGALNWPTLQNKRSRAEIPEECFVRSGPKVLILRDKLLDWWGPTLRPVAAKHPNPPPRPQAGQRRRGAGVAGPVV